MGIVVANRHIAFWLPMEGRTVAIHYLLWSRHPLVANLYLLWLHLTLSSFASVERLNLPLYSFLIARFHSLKREPSLWQNAASAEETDEREENEIAAVKTAAMIENRLKLIWCLPSVTPVSVHASATQYESGGICHKFPKYPKGQVWQFVDNLASTVWKTLIMTLDWY